MAQDPYRYFRIEAGELHEQLGQGCLDLEKSDRSADLVPRLLRLAHTLKGAARVVKQREIADHAHAIEEALSPFRESTSIVPRDRVDALLKLLDGIAERVAVLSSPKPAEPAQAVAEPPGRASVDEVVRTRGVLDRANVAEMDALLDGIGEVAIQLGAVRRSRISLEHAQHLIDLLVEQLAPHRAGIKTHSLAQELQTIVSGIEQGLASGVDQVDHELRQVRDAAEQMRLVPAGVLFTSLERAVRDVAQAQGKSVRFEGRGGDVRLDAHVLGAVHASLLQLARNAVAHGIEVPADRKAAGKPSEGRVAVDVSRRGRRAAFTCDDDGRGVDVEAVKRAAQRKGILPSEIGELGAEQLVGLLLRGGLSTSRTVTELSGRGIGLDLLREAAERLGGEVTVRTNPGKGTAMELVVPLSIASVQGLVVEASGATVVIPLDAIKRTLRIARSDLARTAQGESVVHAGKEIPFVALARLLSTRSTPAERPTWSAVVVEGANGLAAVGVDRLLGTATVVQRPLPDLAPTTAVVAGASLDSSGNPQLVLDPDGLVAAATGAALSPEPAELRGRRILVIDDSVTTRMLERSILESAGYDVDVATSAEEALEKASLERYGLFLVDVEMPGMDGFSFIERTREDASLREIACILVTSRASPEDRRRGQQVGAQGYIDKGEFDQNALLDQIRRLVT